MPIDLESGIWGVSGYNTEQEAYQLQHFVLDRKPNWVVVGYNINDVEPIGVDPSLVRKEEKSQESLIGRLTKYIENDLLITQFVKQRIGNLIRLFDPNWYASTYVQDTVNQYLAPDGAWRNNVSVLLGKNENRVRFKGSWLYCSCYCPLCWTSEIILLRRRMM